MINNYFQTSINRPTFSKNYLSSKTIVEKNIKQAQYNRYKLFILIIAKANSRVIKSSLDIMHQNSKIVPDALAKIIAHAEKNINLCVFLAF